MKSVLKLGMPPPTQRAGNPPSLLSPHTLHIGQGQMGSLVGWRGEGVKAGTDMDKGRNLGRDW